MRTIHVVCAVIARDGAILATQRGYGPLKDGWEFPGGKVEPGETESQALVREIREELDAEVAIERSLCHVTYDYDDFTLDMDCFLCTLPQGRFELLEHEDARWLDAATIDSVDWLPADHAVVEAIKRTVFQGDSPAR